MQPHTKNVQSHDCMNREEIIVRYASLIKYIAGRIAQRLPPTIDLNDVIHSGVVGLIDAIDKYDAEKGVQFKTYAEFRIRGAILDNLRSLDWAPRSVRKSVTQLEKTYTELEKTFNRPATDEEVASAMDIDLDKFYELLSQARGINLLSLEMISSSEDTRLKLLDCLSDASYGTPLTAVGRKEISAIIARAIDELPEKDRLVVSLYYYDERTMKEISLILGLTESRVSQIHTKAILRLRGRLNEMLDVI
jgi:RNA polymerase sigma factor FliA